ncbi:hypothetical protein M2408_004578 [Sphingobacterium sp. BIGb0165]|nr:hypothetical protein [Sphingobacterium sp. BIGb0165]
MPFCKIGDDSRLENNVRVSIIKKISYKSQEFVIFMVFSSLGKTCSDIFVFYKP